MKFCPERDKKVKKLRVQIREVSKVIYEVEVDDDFTDFDDFVKVGDLLWSDGVGPDPIEAEVESEEIEDTWLQD